MKMHEGAVEQGVAFADHGDHASGIEPRRNRGSRAVIERTNRLPIGRLVLVDFGRDRKPQCQLLGIGRNMLGRDRAAGPDATGLGEMRHHVGRCQRPHRLKRHELRVAGADADTDQSAAHGSGLARALMAAAVIALPPTRPWTVMKGTPRGWLASARLASAAPTKPTGTAMIAAGLGAPASSISNSRNSAVGALPIATIAPASRSVHNSSAAADRVVPSRAARSGTRASRSVQITGLSAGSRARVMPWATISESHRIAAPAPSAPRAAATTVSANIIWAASSTLPQAWIMRIATGASSARKWLKSASARMIANER